MRREELAQALAHQHHISKAEARDQLDEVVHRILTALRQGQPAEMPGVGSIVTDKTAETTIGRIADKAHHPTDVAPNVAKPTAPGTGKGRPKAPRRKA